MRTSLKVCSNYGIDQHALEALLHNERNNALREVESPRFTLREYDEYSRVELEVLGEAGFYRDTGTHLILTNGEKPLAWIGFDALRRGSSLALAVSQIQGAKCGVPLFKGWVRFLIRSIVVASDIDTICVQPAELNPYWIPLHLVDEELASLRHRLKYYYDVVPRTMGFRLARDSEILAAKEEKRERPYHTFVRSRVTV